MFLFIDGSLRFFLEASCQLLKKVILWRVTVDLPVIQIGLCVSVCTVCSWYWMLWILNKGMNTHPPYFHTNTVRVQVFALNLSRRHLQDIKLLSMSLFSAANKTQRKTQSYRRYSLLLTAPFLWCFPSDLAVCVCLCFSFCSYWE